MTDMLDRPFPAPWTVRQARDAYLQENGFTVASYEEAWTEASLFGIPFKVPNTPRHRSSIMLHDLHHVATGFGTDLAGEGEISAWEMRRGLGPVGLYVGSIVTMGALGGFLFAPRRALAAWRCANVERGSLFVGGAISYEALLDLTVGELRERLGVPREGLVLARALHTRAPRRLDATA